MNKIENIITFTIKMLKDELPGFSQNGKTKIVLSVNHYKLGKLLGQGTFGKVFYAIDERDNSVCAVKEVFQDRRYKNRELDIISRLQNDNIIEMKDYYFINKGDDKYLYIVMDYYETNLQSILKQHRKTKTELPRDVRKVLAFQIFKALYYMESNMVCHRDLKPPNLLINPHTFELRICDFGSAKILDKIEKNVSYICSRYYRAPELLLESSSYRTEIDVWSAGCILIQLFTKEPIFPGDSALEQLIQILKVMGTPDEQYLQKYVHQMKEPLKLPKIPSTPWSRILKMYAPQQSFLDLISKILVYDTTQRFTPFQVLSHEYFHELPELQLTKKLPNLFQFQKFRTGKNGKQVAELKRIYVKEERLSQKMEVKLETQDSTPLHEQTQK